MVVRRLQKNENLTVDFSLLDKSSYVKAIHFIFGAVCALEGEIQESKDQVYIFTLDE